MDPKPTPMEKAGYKSIASTFIDRPSTTREQYNSGQRFHQDETNIEGATAFPADDLDQRLEIARNVETNIRAAGHRLNQHGQQYARLAGYRLNIGQLAIFLTADINALRYMLHQDYTACLLILEGVEACVNKFLAKEEKAPKVPEASPKTPKPKAAYGEGEGRRSTATAAKRDGGLCAFSQTPDGDIAHIWPQIINNNVEHFNTSSKILQSVLGNLSPALFAELRNILFPYDAQGKPICRFSDVHWNMLTLNPQLHRWWTKAKFGLEPLKITLPFDEDHVVIRVKWHWLPKQLSDALQAKDKILPVDEGVLPPRLTVKMEAEGLANVLKEALNDCPGADSSTAGNPFAFLPSGRRIESGMVFDLKVAKVDAEKMVTLLDAQWLVVRMVAISGAADVADELLDDLPRWMKEAVFLPEIMFDEEAHSAPQTPARGPADSAVKKDDKQDDQPGESKAKGR